MRGHLVCHHDHSVPRSVLLAGVGRQLGRGRDPADRRVVGFGVGNASGNIVVAAQDDDGHHPVRGEQHLLGGVHGEALPLHSVHPHDVCSGGKMHTYYL